MGLHTENVALWVVTIGGAVGVLVALARKLRSGYREGKKDARAFRDAILGRDAVLHPETGRELAPAVPGVGARMATIEDAVAKIAASHQRVDALEGRVAALEQKDLERALARTESIELMRTIDTAIKADPTPEVDK